MNMQHTKSIHPVGIAGGKQRRALPIVLEVAGVLLFLLFMTPFLMVLLNSAKTAKEIIIDPIAWPEQLGADFSRISG